MVLPHSSTQKYLFTLGGQFAAARGGQYDRLLQLDSVKANAVIDLKVRPNPSSESFEINFENKSHLEYSIYTIQGLKVENGTVSNGQTIGLELKLGLYLLAVKNTEGTFSQTIKIIKL